MSETLHAQKPVEVYTKAEIDQLLAGLGAAPARKRIPTWIDLFGRTDGGMTGTYPPDWWHVGTAYTSSTVFFPGNFEVAVPAFAAFRVNWTPRSAGNLIRLVKVGDNGFNPEEICVIPGRVGDGVFNEAIDITAALQAIRAAQEYKTLLFQMKSDGTPWTLFMVRLEIIWEV